MRKRDCAFLAYLQTIATLLPPSEGPLKTSAQRILACVHSPLVQMQHKISGVTGAMFTKFVAVVIVSSTVGVNTTIRVAICSPVVE